MRDDEAERWEVQEAEQEMRSASWAVIRAEDRLGGDLDLENRKAVARHLAALIREGAEPKLRAEVSRSDDPEVRRAVPERKDEVARPARYLARKPGAWSTARWSRPAPRPTTS